MSGSGTISICGLLAAGAALSWCDSSCTWSHTADVLPEHTGGAVAVDLLCCCFRFCLVILKRWRNAVQNLELGKDKGLASYCRACRSKWEQPSQCLLWIAFGFVFFVFTISKSKDCLKVALGCVWMVHKGGAVRNMVHNSSFFMLAERGRPAKMGLTGMQGWAGIAQGCLSLQVRRQQSRTWHSQAAPSCPCPGCQNMTGCVDHGVKHRCCLWFGAW